MFSSVWRTVKYTSMIIDTFMLADYLVVLCFRGLKSLMSIQVCMDTKIRLHANSAIDYEKTPYRLNVSLYLT